MEPVVHIKVKRVHASSASEEDDSLAVEQPLAIAVEYVSMGKRLKQDISITMRTPGADGELAAGFLFTEGILRQAGEVMEIRQDYPNEVLVRLHDHVHPDLPSGSKSFLTTSACGVCGKQDVNSLYTTSLYAGSGDTICVDAAVFYRLQQELKKRQSLFNDTGGIHAAALFDLEGRFLHLREDVGRHNALDKIIGRAFLDGLLPLDNVILLLSGRASFELLQKAGMAGIKMAAAVGAPSSMAAEQAAAAGITLVGFLREDRFNVYSGWQRIGL